MSETEIRPERPSPKKDERAPRETSGEKILTALEAVLFSSPRPVREKDLADLLEATPGGGLRGARDARRRGPTSPSGASASRRWPAAGAS